MSYNGSGTFQINTTGQPVVTGTVISSSAFNALTADLATGLSTAITKDGQTATTARIPFAAGINSTLVTDSTSTSTGSIITAGGIGVAKAAFIGTTLNVASTTTLTGVATLTANPVLSAGTANGVTYLNGSKSLTSGSAITFDGTNFATTGTATATKLIPTGSSVTGNGLYLPAANALGLSTNGTNAVYIDASQNVGIGTSSPTGRLNLAVGASTACTMRFTSNSTGTGAGDKDRLDFYSADNTGTAYQLGYMDYDRSDGTGTASYIAWANRVAGTVAERMRIDSSGNLLVGTTATTPSVGFAVLPTVASGGTSIRIGHPSGVGSGNGYTEYFYNSTAIGSVTQNGTTGVLYNVTSDYRLKNNQQPLTGAKNFIMALQPKKWQWWDGSGEGVGFVAHEFMEVAKHSGVGEKDAVDIDGNPVYQSIQPSSSEVMANLVSFIQEQQALITAQAATITALTARITALESK